MKKETKLTQKMSSSGVAGVECNIAASVKLTDGDKVLLFPSQGVFYQAGLRRTQHGKTKLVINVHQQS